MMAVHKLTVEIEVETQELIDILVTAVEGGSGYWAHFRKYDCDAGTVEIRENDQDVAEKPGWHALGPDDIARGLQLAALKEPRTFAHWHGDRCGDAGSSDNILQLALFGEVVYE